MANVLLVQIEGNLCHVFPQRLAEALGNFVVRVCSKHRKLQKSILNIAENSWTRSKNLDSFILNDFGLYMHGWFRFIPLRALWV